MKKIAVSILDKWDANAVSIHHRVGTLAIKEAAVIIAVSALNAKSKLVSISAEL
mgnify:CR=1 FL=1